METFNGTAHIVQLKCIFFLTDEIDHAMIYYYRNASTNRFDNSFQLKQDDYANDQGCS
jgi:hypothetical protein